MRTGEFSTVGGGLREPPSRCGERNRVSLQDLDADAEMVIETRFLGRSMRMQRLMAETRSIGYRLSFIDQAQNLVI